MFDVLQPIYFTIICRCFEFSALFFNVVGRNGVRIIMQSVMSVTDYQSMARERKLNNLEINKARENYLNN